MSSLLRLEFAGGLRHDTSRQINELTFSQPASNGSAQDQLWNTVLTFWKPE